MEKLECDGNSLAELDVPASLTNSSFFGEQTVTGQVLSVSANDSFPYKFNMSKIITSSGNLSHVTYLEAYDSSSGSIRINTLSGGVIQFESKPARITYDYKVSDFSPMNVTVIFSGTAPLITTQELPSGIKGNEYTAYINISDDLNSFDISGLPEGLSSSALPIDTFTDPFTSQVIQISGTPTVSGSYEVDVLVSNDYGQDTKTFTLYVAPFSNSIKINAENFPDRVFMEYISANYDTNKDGELNNDEINAITTFPANFSYTANPNTGITITNPASLNITNLKGIEYFTALQTVCLPQGVTEVDLSNKLSLDAFFMNGAELKSLDLSGDNGLTVFSITVFNQNEEVKKYYCPPAIQWPGCFPSLKYLKIESRDLTQLNLSNNKNLEWANIGKQYASADLISDDNSEYPYAFDFRTIVSEDNLSKISRDSIVVLDKNGGNVEYSSNNGILRFKVRPAVIKYKYDAGALNTTMDVEVTIRNEYRVVKPEITISNDDVPEGEQGKDYSFEVTVTGTGPFKW